MVIMMTMMIIIMTIIFVMKNICLSFQLYILCVHGYTFRHILVSLHFNENLHRDAQLTKNGEKYYKVTYPKYKLGEEVVREVASPPTYCEFNYSTVCSYDCSAVKPGVIHFLFQFFCACFLSLVHLKIKFVLGTGRASEHKDNQATIDYLMLLKLYFVDQCNFIIL